MSLFFLSISLQIHMKTMPAAMFRLLTGQETPMYIWTMSGERSPWRAVSCDWLTHHRGEASWAVTGDRGEGTGGARTTSPTHFISLSSSSTFIFYFSIEPTTSDLRHLSFCLCLLTCNGHSIDMRRFSISRAEKTVCACVYERVYECVWIFICPVCASVCVWVCVCVDLLSDCITLYFFYTHVTEYDTSTILLV